MTDAADLLRRHRESPFPGVGLFYEEPIELRRGEGQSSGEIGEFWVAQAHAGDDTPTAETTVDPMAPPFDIGDGGFADGVRVGAVGVLQSEAGSQTFATTVGTGRWRIGPVPKTRGSLLDLENRDATWGDAVEGCGAAIVFQSAGSSSVLPYRLWGDCSTALVAYAIAEAGSPCRSRSGSAAWRSSSAAPTPARPSRYPRWQPRRWP